MKLGWGKLSELDIDLDAIVAVGKVKQTDYNSYGFVVYLKASNFTIEHPDKKQAEKDHGRLIYLLPIDPRSSHAST